MASNDEEIVFFHYPGSAFQIRVKWYLKLAGIQYTDCLQPSLMPRPDLAALGISYRRIPILSIGKHIYCDSRLILQILQSKFPLPHHPLTPSDKGLEKLLQGYSLDGGLMTHTFSFIPFEHFPALQDPVFIADRTDYMQPFPFRPDLLLLARPDSLAHLRNAAQVWESTFFADGRDWILGSDKGPSAADIEAVFPFYMLLLVWKAPNHDFETRFPKLFEWVMRFYEAVEEATKVAPEPKSDCGENVVKRLLSLASSSSSYPSSSPEEKNFDIDKGDPSGLEANQIVDVFPTDTGSSGRQRGRLVILNTEQVCVSNDKNLYVHFPRWNYRIVPVSEKE